MNKKMLFFGSRNKADYILYIANVMTAIEKRVLIVDFTHTEIYRKGYTRLKENESLFDYRGIDILVGANDWKDIDGLLLSNKESIENYDVIIIDVDSEQMLNTEWPAFEEVIYMGDFDRIHLMQDAIMIDAFADKYPATKFRRMTFETKYKINQNTLESFLKKDVTWNSVHIIFEADEMIEALRLEMQHQLTMPFNNINSEHREHIIGLVSEFYEMHIADIKDAMNGGRISILGKLFGLSKNTKMKSTKALTETTKIDDANDLVLMEKFE